MADIDSNLPARDASDGASGSAVPPYVQQVGGKDNSSNLQPLKIDAQGGLIIAGEGTAGTPAGGVLSIQGVASGTAVPVSQSGSWTVTANAGTNLNTSALALDATVAKLTLSQGSTTSGQQGPLIQGAVTTAAPAYTDAQTSPLSLTTSGALRTDSSATVQPVSQSGTWSTRTLDGSGNSIGSTTGALNVNVTNSFAAGISDKTTFTYGTSIQNAIGAVFQDTSPSVTAGQQGALRMTSVRGLHSNLRDSSGNELLGSKVSASSVPVVIASDQGPVPASQSGTWTVQQGSTPTAVANAWPVKLTDGTNTTAVKAASTAAAASDPSAVVALSPNSPLPSGSNTIGKVQLLDGSGTSISSNYGAASAALRVAAQIGNATAVADFGAGATSSQTIRTASNLYDGSANAIASTLINSKQRLDVNLPSEGQSGSAVPFDTVQVGGSDGTNLRAISTDSSGRIKLAGSSYFHPTYTLRVQAVPAATGALATSLAISVSSTASGNLIAVSVSSSVAGTVTVTDNLAQTYTSAISGTSGTHTSYIFYKANTAAGVTSITVSSTSSSGICAIATEYSGISSTPLDKTSTGTVVGASAFSSGSTAATTSSVELLLGSAHGVTKNNQTYTAGTSWSSVSTSNGFNAGAGQLYMEDQYVGITGAYAATGTASGNDTIIGNIATFVITNTNLLALNSPKVIKSGSGILKRIIINTTGTGSPTLTLYDNTTNSGTIIGIISLVSAINSLEYNLVFTTGLTLVVNSATSDFTVVYE